MELIVEREDVWAASIEDTHGALANKLGVLAEAGADLDFIIARRSPERPGQGVVFVTPLRSDQEVEAATQVGFAVTSRMHSIRVEGKNAPGLAAKLAQKIGQAGVNLRGLSAGVIGTGFVLHLAFDSQENADKAIQILRQ